MLYGLYSARAMKPAELRARRQGLGLTQAQLGAKLGVAANTIARWERGATPVGSVHLGIVHLFELAEPKVKRREQVLTQAGFAPLAELWPKRDEFETWSQYVLAALHEGRK